MKKQQTEKLKDSTHVNNGPSVKEVQEFFYLKGLSMVEAWQFINFYQLQGWKNSKGKPISSWKLAAARWTEMICTRYPYLVQPKQKSVSKKEKMEPLKPFLDIHIQIFPYRGTGSSYSRIHKNRQ